MSANPVFRFPAFPSLQPGRGFHLSYCRANGCFPIRMDSFKCARIARFRPLVRSVANTRFSRIRIDILTLCRWTACGWEKGAVRLSGSRMAAMGSVFYGRVWLLCAFFRIFAQVPHCRSLVGGGRVHGGRYYMERRLLGRFVLLTALNLASSRKSGRRQGNGRCPVGCVLCRLVPCPWLMAVGRGWYRHIGVGFCVARSDWIGQCESLEQRDVQLVQTPAPFFCYA